MTGALVVGLAAAAGVALAWSGLAPAPPPLARQLAALGRQRSVPPARGEWAITPGLARLWRGSALARRLGEALAADLRICGLSLDQHVAERVVALAVAVAWAPLAAAAASLAGVSVGPALPAWAAAVSLPLGLAWPGLALRSRAARRRLSFRHAFGAFVDVVAVALAAGRGVDTALADAAAAGRGWAFAELRRALVEARLAGEPPWAGLERLGRDLGVPELTELAASAALAGAEGARVRASLAAKARALRLHGLLEVERAAQAASELMSAPVVALMFGFVVFLGYPAVAKVLEGV